MPEKLRKLEEAIRAIAEVAAQLETEAELRSARPAAALRLIQGGLNSCDSGEDEACTDRALAEDTE